MKSAKEIIVIAENAIRANYSARNTRVVSGNSARHRRILATRRDQLREWVSVLRIARDPSNAMRIAQVTNARPLAAHSLRTRVLSLA